jgi:hypothetical protein
MATRTRKSELAVSLPPIDWTAALSGQQDLRPYLSSGKPLAKSERTAAKAALVSLAGTYRQSVAIGTYVLTLGLDPQQGKVAQAEIADITGFSQGRVSQLRMVGHALVSTGGALPAGLDFGKFSGGLVAAMGKANAELRKIDSTGTSTSDAVKVLGTVAKAGIKAREAKRRERAAVPAQQETASVPADGNPKTPDRAGMVKGLLAALASADKQARELIGAHGILAVCTAGERRKIREASEALAKVLGKIETEFASTDKAVAEAEAA